MWRRNQLTDLARALLLLLMAVPCAFASDAMQVIAGEILWRGEVVLNEPVKVMPEAVLRLAAGTEIRIADPEHNWLVQGRLMIEGTSENPVIFSTSPGWKGIEFMEPRGECSIQHAYFSQAESALRTFAARLSVRDSEFHDTESAILLMRESLLQVENCRFSKNNVGIDSRMKSAAVVRNSRFENHKVSAIVSSHGGKLAVAENDFVRNRQGIGLKGKLDGLFGGNVFSENGAGIFCHQTQGSPRIERNHFEKNENAVINRSFASPDLLDNRFVANRTAMRNDQFSAATIRNNLFDSNVTALHNNRKSNPLVEKNLFRDNERALFCDYSSYPKVRRNNFAGNEMAVELGRFQSADFEALEGSKNMVLQQAQIRRSRNPLLARSSGIFKDAVDVSGNWWGERTALLAAAGDDGNLDFFQDRCDRPEMTYEGWGDRTFALDHVVFAPWLKEAVPDAGPRGGEK